ncbi:MAG: hypothetical protein EBR82_12245 [Caulobacteraceae bacterium]|jgi:hypothetical protein|nr:hypothetical protein [Caulobacteraceae bacterium]
MAKVDTGLPGSIKTSMTSAPVSKTGGSNGTPDGGIVDKGVQAKGAKPGTIQATDASSHAKKLAAGNPGDLSRLLNTENKGG